MKNFILPLLCALTACSPIIERKIASTPQKDLLRLSEEILGTVSSEQFDSRSCKRFLAELEVELDATDLQTLNRTELIASAGRIADNSWKIRTTLHQRLEHFDRDCVYQIQSTFRQLRFIEDYLQELSLEVKHLTPKDIKFSEQPVPMKSQTDYYINRFTEGNELKLEDGDVLVTRGVSFLSGMIARLGSRATQFSHIVFVHKDPETQKLKTIESYVGVGVQFYDLDFALKNENARILWLRSKDKNLAMRASALMSKLVKTRIQQKNPIKYDYALDFNDSSTMSCAEVSQVAFQLASQGSFQIPYYPNEINGADSLVQRLNIAKGATYEPGDMEVDPRFKLMGEFQDLRLTRDSRQKDAVMSAVFNWMDQYQYELHDNMTSKMAGGIIHKARRTFIWPLLRRAMKIDDFSKEIPANMLSTVTLVNELGAILLAELNKQDLEFEQTHGIPMSAPKMMEALENFRQQDLEKWQNKKSRKKAQFHSLFRAKQ